MKKEYNLKQMTIKSKGALPKDSTVQKTIRIDLDVLSWLLQESDHKGIPYQTLINSLLKEVMNRRISQPAEATVHLITERLNKLEKAVTKISAQTKIAI